MTLMLSFLKDYYPLAYYLPIYYQHTCFSLTYVSQTRDNRMKGAD